MGLGRRCLDWRRRHGAAITVTGDGFRLSHGAGSRAGLLKESLIEVDEEIAGFAPFRAAMQRRFHIPAAWYIDITAPASEPAPRAPYLHPDLATETAP